VFSAVFLGEQKMSIPEKTTSMLFVVIVLTVLSLAAGIFVAFPMKLVHIATSQITYWLQ
jgi:hypothetical protein